MGVEAVQIDTLALRHDSTHGSEELSPETDMRHLPKKSPRVRRLLVVGAGMDQVNGVYSPARKYLGGEVFFKESKMGPIFIRRQVFNDDPYDKRHWRITLSAEHDKDHLYKHMEAAEHHSSPPVLGWEVIGSGEGRYDQVSDGNLGDPPHKLEYYCGPLDKMIFASEREKATIEELQVDTTRKADSVKANKLTVVIVSARDLRDADWMTGGSDPYCVCEIRDKPDTMVKTQVINGTSNPVWQFVADIPDYEEGDELYFKVFDQDYGKDDDFLGHCLLDHEHLHPHGFIGEVLLEEAGKGVQARLNLCITLPGQEAPGILVQIDKTEGKIGMAIAPDTKHDCLSVRKVMDEGLISQWNQENPDKQVIPGDHIVEVQGARGSSQELAKLIATAPGAVDMLVKRNFHHLR